MKNNKLPSRPANKNDWKTAPLSDQYDEFQIELVLSDEQIHTLKQGFVPSSMEQKWFVFHEDNKINFYRSWTGLCIYIVELNMINYTHNVTAYKYEGINKPTEQEELVRWLLLHFSKNETLIESLVYNPQNTTIHSSTAIQQNPPEVVIDLSSVPCLDKAISTSLSNIGITTAEDFCNADFFELYKSNLTYREFGLIIRKLYNLYNLRHKDCPKDKYPDIEVFIDKKFPLSIDVLGLTSPTKAVCSNNRLFYLFDFTQLTREELSSKGVSTEFIYEINKALIKNDTHFKGETLYICDICNHTYSDLADSTTHQCKSCKTKISKSTNPKYYSVTIDGPEYGSYTNGAKGFTLFATIHNKTKKAVDVKLEEFSVFSNKRQWAPSFSLTGYSFSEDIILPETSKTIGKIWTDKIWANTTLKEKDYITITLEIKESTHIYKFMLLNNAWVAINYLSHKTKK